MKGKYYSRMIKVLIFIIDFWLIHVAFTVAKKMGLTSSLTNDQYTSLFLIFGLIWIVAGFFTKIYRIDTASLLRDISINLFSTLIIHMLIIGTILLTSGIYSVSLELLCYLYAMTTLLIISFRIIYKLISKYYQFSGFNQRKVVVIGTNASGVSLGKYFMDNEAAGYQFAGFFDEPSNQPSLIKEKIVGTLDPTEIKSFCNEHSVGEIYFVLPTTYKELLEDISKFADDNFIYFRLSPAFSKTEHENGNVFLMNSIPVMTNRKEPLGISVNANLKRLFDIGFSIAVILLVFPFILPIVALAICIDSKGPVFFKQLRPGKKNKLFDCYKFRTMQINGTREVQATKNDSRITRVGRFLRKTSLDEFPQFFNVLLGNMSVVGPRPNMISQLEEYSKTIQNYGVRHFITPGITGYAQVNGFRGEIKNIGLMEKRVEYDVQYIENWSLALDLKIIFLTVWNIGKGEKNAY